MVMLCSAKDPELDGLVEVIAGICQLIFVPEMGDFNDVPRFQILAQISELPK
jgi:hypothetical protein